MMATHVWTVRNAKAKLSELLRRVRDEGPQRIGEREAFIVITEAEWQRLVSPKPHLGAWLLQNMPEIDELELPERHDRARPLPFGDASS